MAHVLSLWPKLKPYFQTAIRWIAETVTIGHVLTLTWVALALLICAEYRVAIACTNDRNQLAMLHTSIGDVLRQKAGAGGNMDDAIAEYHAIVIDPDYYWAHDNLGLIWLDQGKLDEAIAEFRRATRIIPEIEGFNANLLRAQKEKDAGPPKEAGALR